MAWLNMNALGIPAAFYLFPAAALAGLVLSAVTIYRLLRTNRPGGCEPIQMTAGRKRAMILLVCVACAGLGVFAAQRVGLPRGLELTLFERIDSGAPGATFQKSEPLVDRFRNPLGELDPPAGAAMWRGFLRVPAYFDTTYLHVGLHGKGLIMLSNKKLFDQQSQKSGGADIHHMKVELKKGFVPIQVLFSPVDDHPYLNLRWSIQDFDFRKTIGQRYFFKNKPARFGALLVEFAFYFLFAGLAALYLLVVLWLKRFDRGGDAG